MQQANVVFIVEMTEYERGWGQRPDGFLAFVTEDAANLYVQEKTKGRKFGSAPDVYVAYNMIGYRVCSATILQKTLAAASSDRPFIYLDKIQELQG